MGRILISTLGTNRYIECNYLFGNTEHKTSVEKVQFIQEATIRYFCKGWSITSGDRIHILCTGEAWNKNWLNGGHDTNSVGLRSRINDLLAEPDFSNLVEDAQNCFVEINDGNSVDEIRKIFEVMYKLIHDDDEIYFDITHGFRSLPMLALVVLQYARQLRKNITVKSITYGAFEALGPVNKIKEIPLQSRTAPVIDLTNFVQLMDWTNAAKDFIDYGQTARLSEVLLKEVAPLLKMSKGNHSEANLSKKVSKGIECLADAISKNNLKELCVFSKLNQNLDNYFLAAPTDLKEFIPIVGKIREKTAAFKENDLGNVFASVRWCVKHQMYQNAYSLLLEGCISIVLDRVGEEYFGQTEKVEQKRKIPIFVASQYRIFQKEAFKKSKEELIAAFRLNEEQEQWRIEFSTIIGKVWSIFTDEVAIAFEKLNNYRNAFMHCGTGTNSNPSDLITKFDSYITILENWYHTY